MESKRFSYTQTEWYLRMNEWKLTKAHFQLLSRIKSLQNCTDALFVTTNKHIDIHTLAQPAAHKEKTIGFFFLSDCNLKHISSPYCDDEEGIIKTQLHKFIAPYNFQLNTMHSHSITAIYQMQRCNTDQLFLCLFLTIISRICDKQRRTKWYRSELYNCGYWYTRASVIFYFPVAMCFFTSLALWQIFYEHRARR